MKTKKILSSAFVAITSFVNIVAVLTLTACDNFESDPPIDITFPEITPPVTHSQTISQTTPPIETEHSVTDDVSIPPIYNEPHQVHMDTEITYKMNEEDEEVKNIIAGLYRKTNALIYFISSPNTVDELITPEGAVSDSDSLYNIAYRFFVNEEDAADNLFARFLPLKHMDYPMISNLDDMREQLATCFTEEIADYCIDRYTAKCEMLAPRDDNLFLVKHISGCETPSFAQIVEIDGKLYGKCGGSGLMEYMCSTFDQIRVLEKTENKITFAYLSLIGLDESISACKGTLVNDGDGWKFGWYCTNQNYDFIDFQSTWLS